jgi:hypothetical protein
VKAHTSAVRDVTYHSRHDSNEHDFVSCGQDGRVRCFDDRDPWTGATYWKNRGTSFIQRSNERYFVLNPKRFHEYRGMASLL